MMYLDRHTHIYIYIYKFLYSHFTYKGSIYPHPSVTFNLFYITIYVQ